MTVRKILRALTNNLGLKLISVVLAFILWLIVVNINNPKTTVTFTAVAEIENSSVITENGKVYEILDDSNVVTFTVTGPRSIVESLSGSDFEVIADMNKIDLALGFVPIDVVPLKNASQITVEKKNTNLKVVIEDLAVEQFVVSAGTAGTPRDGYAAGAVTTTPNTITVSGPQSVISRIAKVVAVVDISNADENVTEVVETVLYDEKGELIDTTNLTVSPGVVEAEAEILVTKEVGIIVGSSGEPAEGYELTELKISPSTVVIKGNKTQLMNISQIEIPETEINIEGIKENREITLDITKYLPEGVHLYDDDLANIVVTAKVKKKINRTIIVDVDQIAVENVPADYKVEFSEESVKVVINGLSEVINEVSVTDLNPTIDLANHEEGEFTVLLSVTTPEGVEQYVETEVSGRLVPKEEMDIEAE